VLELKYSSILPELQFFLKKLKMALLRILHEKRAITEKGGCSTYAFAMGIVTLCPEIQNEELTTLLSSLLNTPIQDTPFASERPLDKNGIWRSINGLH